MAAKTQHPPSTSRIRFGFGPKQSRSRPSSHDPPEHENDEDWYIPYNGPYEMPPSPPSNTYDSSGRLLGSALVHPGSAKSSELGHEWPDGRMAGGQSMMSALPSSGSHSSHPYRMAAASDTPARGPISSQTLRSGRPTLITTSSTAFANIDSTGGVGESPTPVQRSSPLHTSPPSSRLSLGNFLIFNGSTRKSRSDSVHSTRQSSRKLRARNRSLTLDPLQLNHATATATAIPDARHPPRSHTHLSLGQAMERGPRQRSQTLIGTSTAAAQTPSPSHDSYATSFYSRESPLSSHPYAHTFSASRTESPRRAPIVLLPSASRSMDKGKGVDRSHQYSQPPVPDTLSSAHQVPPHLRPASRTSLFKTFSAPNLRNFSRDFSISKHIPRGKYRWLSPETWCDAMLFPRPRFMEYIDDDPPSCNHRQPSLIRPSETTRPARKLHRPLQMTLRGSQSAVNLLAPNSGSSTGPPRAEPMLQRNADGQTSPRRPFSFAQDDIALPSPVLSLTRLVQYDASRHHAN
jgi:serine/arginine repetitive matrix protein 2